MRKLFVIAVREYNAAVRTKAFVIGLLIMPLMMGGTIIVQKLIGGIRDVKDKHFAVIDRTPGAKLLARIQERVAQVNAGTEDSTGKKVRAELKVREVPSSAADAIDEQRFALSEEVRKGKLYGFLDIGPDVLIAPPQIFDPRTGPPSDADDRTIVRYHTNRATFMDFSQLANAVIFEALLENRCDDLKVNPSAVKVAMLPVPLASRGLLKRENGVIKDAGEQSRMAAFLVPFMLVMLMFMIIMSGATPLMQGIVEEKMQRIAEVLLGSVSPFQLMMGKLAGMTGVSLTIGAVYLGGAYWTAGQFGFTDYISPELIFWFLVYQTLAVLMYGAVFIAIGAACSDMKETQNLLGPVMLIACLPLFVTMHVIQEPNGPVATILSFIPFATPMLMIARQAVPPGVPWWQPFVGVLVVLTATAVCVWVAGRIFRVGILMQGKGARLGEIVRWVLRG